ncbi:MAG: PQQ-binding-like beta-propeller repeat protein [Gammaproteobacteria bacterium]|nr:PQQ-binding-like beta-propeller repeat protein [Gammaproteobacteria bacterium]
MKQAHALDRLGLGIAVCFLVFLAGCDSGTEQPPAQVQAAAAQTAAVAATTPNVDAEAVYLERCAQCHDQAFPKAPHRVTFQVIGREAIYAAITDGLMREHAADLSDEARHLLADHLGGSARPSVPPKVCADMATSEASIEGYPLQGWGLTLEGTRFVDAATAGVSKADAKNLKLKWAFAYPGATRARSQPSYYAGSILVGSQNGTVYALDLESGCMRWHFKAAAEVRNAISIRTAVDGASALAFFGDIKGMVYAIDAADGTLVWQTQAGDHPAVTLTGSPRLYNNRLYVPLSSSEWASAADPAYACCTFRGAVVAMNAETGAIDWTTYSIPEAPAPTGELNAQGAQRFHPAGAPIWNSPTIDVQRGLLYVGTGEAYTSPAADTSDSVLAIDLETGELVWSFQATAGDAWNMACFIGGGTNCPAEDGPDLDIGAPPMLTTLSDGRDVIVVGQKSGSVYGLDPNADGKLIWHNKVGRGGFAGGIHWGMAASNDAVFAPNADTIFSGRFTGERKPGLFALDPSSGETLWFTAAPDVCAEADKPACDPGLSAAVTATPEVVFAGAFDGHLRAYDAANGEILWDYDTNRSFDTVSGEAAHGGSIESDGPVVVGGHVLVNSGYLFGDRMAGNVLLAFTAD